MSFAVVVDIRALIPGLILAAVLTGNPPALSLPC
jgi:hypothetical protein